MTDQRPMDVIRTTEGAGVPVAPYPPPGAGFPPSFGVDSSVLAVNPIHQYLMIILRYWWLIVLAGVGGGIYQWHKTAGDVPVFKASSAIRLVDQRPAMTGGLVPEYNAMYGGGSIDPVLTQVQIIESRPVAARVVDVLGLQLRSATPGFYMGVFTNIHVAPTAEAGTQLHLQFTSSTVVAHHGREAATAVYGMPLTIAGITFTVPRDPNVTNAALSVVSFEDAVTEVENGLSPKPRDMTSVIDISYQGGDPYVTQAVASTTATEFKALSAEQARQQSHQRRMFIEGQLAATDSLLYVAEARITNYRRGTQAYSAKDQFATQQGEVATLDKERQQLQDSRQGYVALRDALTKHAQGDPSQLRTVAVVIDQTTNPGVSQLYNQLMRYEATRDSLTTGAFARTPQHPEVQLVDAMIANIEPKLMAAVGNEIAALDVRLGGVAAARTHTEGQIATLPAEEETEQRLERDADNIRKNADKLIDELQVARISESVEAGQVEIVDLAKFPGYSIAPSRRRQVAFGVLFGLMVGVALTIGMDRLNSSIRRWEDLETVMHVPGLALIPQISSESNDDWQSRARVAATQYLPSLVPRPRVVHNDRGSELVMVNDVRSATAESYRKLMTNLMFSASRPGLKVVVVTSASAGEGKTTAASNLAAAFAQQGRRIVLIDADLRRARVHKVFGLSLEPGLTDILIGNATIEQGIRPSGVAGLSILPAGTLPPNPLEFLGGERMRDLLITLRAKFDVVLIDTPPVLATADAALIGMQADGVVMVVRAGKTDRQAARHAVEQIVNLGGRLLGAVLNDPDARTPRYGRYADNYYGYGYAPQG